jgi:hypothetical protein
VLEVRGDADLAKEAGQPKPGKGIKNADSPRGLASMIWQRLGKSENNYLAIDNASAHA